MKLKLSFYSLIILSLIKSDIFARTLVPNPKTSLKYESKYDKITDDSLSKQINDYYLKSIAPTKLLTVGFPDNFKLLDNNIYQYVDLFITTKEVSQQKDRIFVDVEELVASYNKLYKEYLYGAANEAHIAHGKQIKNLEETDIQLRKETLEKLSAEVRSLSIRMRNSFEGTEKNLNSLLQMPEPVGVLRYKESIQVIITLNKIFENLINKINGTIKQLKANGESR